MSAIDRQIVQAIVTHGGSVSRFELMSLIGDVADSEIDKAIKRLEDDNLIKITRSREEADPLITVREKELEKLENVA
jgi:hypothetical protein